MQLAYEFQASSGYMASPYRYVAIGGFGGCNEGGGICIPEELPRLRLRSAPVIRFRGAIGRRVSLGGAYRLYTDSWRVLSHTLFLDVAAALGKALVLKAEFRSYYQSDAVFYRKTYVTAADADYYTRDRELSNLWSQRLSLALEWDKPVAQDRAVLELGALISGTFYGYRNFVGLDRVNAIEATAMVGVRY
jgi:hypothetical protein